MKAKLLTFLMSGVLLLAIAAFAGDKDSWFDMENCGFCKNLLEDPELLPNMIWEHHLITNGMVSVTTVKPEVMKSYHKAMKGMEVVGKAMEKGEMVPMCNFCAGYGELMMAGVVMDHVPTKNGDVMVITSDKPEVVEKIKKFGQRTIDEYAKMAAGETNDAHEGHDHK